MNIGRLYQILQESTRVYRKEEGEVPTENNLEKVDMVFFDVFVDKTRANQNKEGLEKILKQYPESEELAKGPSYMELSQKCELGQECTLRLMALGKTLGLWSIISGKTLGVSEYTTKEMAVKGLLMISGYKIK